jgi:hypothetical protein
MTSHGTRERKLEDRRSNPSACKHKMGANLVQKQGRQRFKY